MKLSFNMHTLQCTQNKEYVLKYLLEKKNYTENQNFLGTSRSRAKYLCWRAESGLQFTHSYLKIIVIKKNRIKKK